MLMLSERDIDSLIDPAAAIAAMAEAYRSHARGNAPAPARLDLPRQSPKGSVLLLAGHAAGSSFAVKANLHVYPDGDVLPRQATSLMLLLDAATCAPKALIATNGFNNHRTAAGLAAAAEALAPAAPQTLAVFGAGKIAPAAIDYLLRVRPFKRLLIVGRDPGRAAALAQATRILHRLDASVADAETAAREADVIVTLTTADKPVFPGDRIKPGALVILAGANRPQAREADDDLIGRAVLYVDDRRACLERAGDILMPLNSGALRPEQILAEIGERLSGQVFPTSFPHDVTVFKSMGIVAQDIGLAELIVARALKDGRGSDFDPVSGLCRPVVPAAAPLEEALVP